MATVESEKHTSDSDAHAPAVAAGAPNKEAPPVQNVTSIITERKGNYECLWQLLRRN